MDESEQPERPDTDAVVQALVGNHRAFLGFLEARLRNRALAEDILQDAFSRGLDKVSTLRNDESAVSWFYRVLRNAVIDHHRRAGTSDKALAQLASEMEAHEEPEVETKKAVCGCVSMLADTLKPEYAAALKRVEVEGVSVKDYAAEAGLTGNNAAVRVFRAREALRKQVVRSCGTCAEHGCLDCHCGQ